MVDIDNIILMTDSYKLNHWNQYPKGTQRVYSYLEARPGGEFPRTVFFGLNYILQRYLTGQVVTYEKIAEARKVAAAHFGNDDYFNLKGWLHILEEHQGRLPLEIHAVPEGTVVPVGNVLMTVENMCDECYWLTNAVESLLTHVWYSSNVATLSFYTKVLLKRYLDETSDNADGLEFMLHDFGYRGVSSHESGGIGGLAHLVNFKGTDTLPALQFGQKYYSADLKDLAFSVAATEHSIMTAKGAGGEEEVLGDLLDKYKSGILSVVSDSYNIYEFVKLIGHPIYADTIKRRDGVFVVRPDSVTTEHPSPASLVVWILTRLAMDFGSSANQKGYVVLDPHVRVLWGDGIDYDGIHSILSAAHSAGFSAENLVFGMGGGLLQKHNRDTQRFAFKCSAQKRGGTWYDIYKEPLDSSKKSKRGRMELYKRKGEWFTKCRYADGSHNNPQLIWSAPFARPVLEKVFADGWTMLSDSRWFARIRERASGALDEAVFDKVDYVQ